MQNLVSKLLNAEPNRENINQVLCFHTQADWELGFLDTN